MKNRKYWTDKIVDEMVAANNTRSYKRTHHTWDNYCWATHGISTTFSYRLMNGRRSHKHPIPSELRWEIWERDDFRCAYCGSRRFLSIDHKIPESKGGSMEKENLVTSCLTCNKKKGSKIGLFTQISKSP
jgi:HNH endonuclease